MVDDMDDDDEWSDCTKKYRNRVVLQQKNESAMILVLAQNVPLSDDRYTLE
jgi:hypothetical protein